jgi:hypothetical protein
MGKKEKGEERRKKRERCASFLFFFFFFRGMRVHFIEKENADFFFKLQLILILVNLI